MPDIQSTAASVSTPQTRTGVPTTSTQSLNSSTAIQDARNLAEAFNLLSRYGDEFMDDHPLVGEPGSFIISKKSAEPPVPARPQPAKPNPPGTSTIGKPGTPAATPAIKTDPATIGTAKAGKGAEKTPVTPNTAGSGGKEKPKKKKSKVGSAVA
jgi:mediator of RNA polymerase II transcription subunit 6